MKGIEKAKLADVRAFHATHYGPRGTHLVAVGDFDPALLKAEMVKVFGQWTNSEGAKTLPVSSKKDARDADVNLPEEHIAPKGHGLYSAVYH